MHKFALFLFVKHSLQALLHELKMRIALIKLLPSGHLYTLPVSQRFGHPRVLGIPIPISLAFWASPVGDAKNADHFDFGKVGIVNHEFTAK